MPPSKEVLEAYGSQQLDKYTHWVYVLRCRCQYRTFDKLERKAESRLDYTPSWLRMAFESSRLYYIGQTENLELRMGQHFEGYHNSDFTELFPPSDIERIEPQFSRNQAEWREQRLYESWRENVDGFVYSK